MEAIITKQDYTCQIIVPQTEATVFEVLTKSIPDWWTQNFEGAAALVNDIFKIRFGNTHKTMQIEAIIPNKKVVWRCLQAYIDMKSLNNKSEWEGTQMVWEIAPNGDSTSLLLTHHGLNRDFECYDVCEKGWDYYIKESLYPLLTSGTGMPETKA